MLQPYKILSPPRSPGRVVARYFAGVFFLLASMLTPAVHASVVAVDSFVGYADGPLDGQVARGRGFEGRWDAWPTTDVWATDGVLNLPGWFTKAEHTLAEPLRSEGGLLDPDGEFATLQVRFKLEYDSQPSGNAGLTVRLRPRRGLGRVTVWTRLDVIEMAPRTGAVEASTPLSEPLTSGWHDLVVTVHRDDTGTHFDYGAVWLDGQHVLEHRDDFLLATDGNLGRIEYAAASYEAYAVLVDYTRLIAGKGYYDIPVPASLDCLLLLLILLYVCRRDRQQDPTNMP